MHAKMDDYGDKYTIDVCCADMAQAMESGTDWSELYSLVSTVHPKRDGKWHFNNSVPVPRYCPWCGAENGEKAVILVTGNLFRKGTSVA